MVLVKNCLFSSKFIVILCWVLFSEKDEIQNMFTPEQCEHTAVTDEGKFETDPRYSVRHQASTNVDGKVRVEWRVSN